MKKITISNIDFEEFVKDCRRDDFVYFDPPYDVLTDTANFTDYNQWWFGRDEQTRLFNTFDKLNKDNCCYVMLSNHNTPFIRDLYKEYRKEIVLAKRMINSDATKRWAIEEIVVLNYKN